MYESGKVAHLLNISPATLRYLVRIYGEFLSDKARKSRRRNFSDADIAVLSRMLSLEDNNQDFSEKANELRSSINDSQLLEDRINTMDLRLRELENKLQEIAEMRSELTMIKKSLQKQNS